MVSGAMVNGNGTPPWSTALPDGQTTATINQIKAWRHGTPWSTATATAAATAHGQQSIQRHDQTSNNQPHSMEAWERQGRIIMVGNLRSERGIASAVEVLEFDFMTLESGSNLRMVQSYGAGSIGAGSIVQAKVSTIESYKLKYRPTKGRLIDTLACTIPSGAVRLNPWIHGSIERVIKSSSGTWKQRKLCLELPTMVRCRCRCRCR